MVKKSLNQISISLIRSEQTSTAVVNFISMYLFICQFSKSTRSNVTSLGLSDVKAEEEEIKEKKRKRKRKHV